jgi:regulator of protease activity HflC (stomatin/prohibitin superfamily)
LINVSEGERQMAINLSEGSKQKRINEANGRAESIRLVADATSKSLKMVGEAIEQPGGRDALKMKLVDQYIGQLGDIIEGGYVSMFPAEIATLKGIVEELKGQVGPLVKS